MKEHLLLLLMINQRVGMLKHMRLPLMLVIAYSYDHLARPICIECAVIAMGIKQIPAALMHQVPKSWEQPRTSTSRVLSGAHFMANKVICLSDSVEQREFAGAELDLGMQAGRCDRERWHRSRSATGAGVPTDPIFHPVPM